MSSREDILGNVQKNQPDLIPLAGLPEFAIWFNDPVVKFAEVLSLIGAQVHVLDNAEMLAASIAQLYPEAQRIVSNIPDCSSFAEIITGLELPHTFENVDVAIVKGQFGVAENGAVWLTEQDITERALPFICQSLVLVLQQKDIVATMHDAYKKIGQERYPYGSFIAGPSKTADIEQSLVLGAHGPRSMNLFLLP